MNPAVLDPRRTLEYGQSHDAAQRALPWTLGAVALGLFILSAPDGTPEPKDTALGLLIIAGALVFLGVLVWRRAQPSVAGLVVSEQGILFRHASERTIPWSEIRAVAPDKVSGSKDVFATRVVRLDVSPQFYERFAGGRWLERVVAESGDPSAIYLAYHLDAPHDELYAAVMARWRAFNHHAADAGAADAAHSAAARAASPDRGGYDEPPLAGSAPTAAPRRSRVIERASGLQGLKALGGLFGGGGIVRAIVNFAALGLIAVLLANVLGYWSTAAQLEGRAEAAKWKTWHEERDREQAAFDEQTKRTREKFDRMFRCMNETFDRGPGAVRSPECEKE